MGNNRQEKERKEIDTMDRKRIPPKINFRHCKSMNFHFIAFHFMVTAYQCRVGAAGVYEDLRLMGPLLHPRVTRLWRS